MKHGFEPGRKKWCKSLKKFEYYRAYRSMNKLGCPPSQVASDHQDDISCLVGDSELNYKPSFATITGKGDNPMNKRVHRSFLSTLILGHACPLTSVWLQLISFNIRRKTPGVTNWCSSIMSQESNRGVHGLK